MKKHLVLLCGQYFPDPSPTGLCSHRYMQLLRDLYNVDVIFCQSGLKVYEGDVNCGFILHSITSWRFVKERSSLGLMRKFFHLLGQLQILMFPSGNMKWYRKKALKALEAINHNNKIDVIVSVCSPFESHLAGIDFKKKHQEIKHIAYTVDLYSTKERIRPFYVSYHCLQRMEQKVFESVDRLLLSEEIFSNQKTLYQNVNKVFSLPYLLPDFPATPQNHYFDKNIINCVYAGRFYKDIRNPESLLKVFSFVDATKYKLHLFSVGCEDIVKKYADIYSNIVIHKQVQQDSLAEILCDADCLINLGNSTASFKPSKTFEYIVTGKPIVHFYYPQLEDDELKKYPLALQMCNDEEPGINSNILSNFLNNSIGKYVPQEKIMSLYSKHSKEAIMNLLVSAIEQ